MYKILLFILVSLAPLLVTETMYAGQTVTVKVTEKVPGAICVPTGDTNSTTPIERRVYLCTVDTGLTGFQALFASIIRWVVNIVMLIGVLAIVGVGIAWSLAGGDDAKAKGEIKKWAMNIFVGMLILFFFRYILQLLAPWVYK